MAGWALPMDASSGSPSFPGAQHRAALSALMGTPPAGRPLGATSGVRPGTPTNTITLSGAGSMTWNCAALSGVFDAEASVTAGPYLFATDGTDTGAIAAQGASARTDNISFVINDASQDASGLRSGVVTYTPNSSVAPTRGLLLATIAVPASGGGAPVVSWVAPVTGSAIVAYTNSGSAGGTFYNTQIGPLKMVFGAINAVNSVGAGLTSSGVVNLPSNFFIATPFVFFGQHDVTTSRRFAFDVSGPSNSSFTVNVTNMDTVTASTNPWLFAIGF